MGEKSKSGPIHWKGGGYNKTRQMEITPMWALNTAAQNMDRFGTSDLELIQLLLAEDARKTLESQAAGNPFTKDNERSMIIAQAMKNIKRSPEEYKKLQNNLDKLGEEGRLSNEDFAIKIQKGYMRADDFNDVTSRRTTGGTQKERQAAKDAGVNVQEIQRAKLGEEANAQDDAKKQDEIKNMEANKALDQESSIMYSPGNKISNNKIGMTKLTTPTEVDMTDEISKIDSTNFEISDNDYSLDELIAENDDQDLINQVKDDLNESLQWYVDAVDILGDSPRSTIGGSARSKIPSMYS